MSMSSHDPTTWREPTIVSREEWEAREPRGPIAPLHTPVPYFFITWAPSVPHCYAPTECKAMARELQKLHMDAGAPDLPYSFLIGDDGQVYEGRGWKLSVPVHPRYAEREGHALVFAYIGKKIWKKVIDERESWQLDTFADYRAAYELLNYGLDEGYIDGERFMTGYRWEPEDWNTYGGTLKTFNYDITPEEHEKMIVKEGAQEEE